MLERAIHVAYLSFFRRDEDIESRWTPRPTAARARSGYRPTGSRRARRRTSSWWTPAPRRRRWSPGPSAISCSRRAGSSRGTARSCDRPVGNPSVAAPIEPVEDEVQPVLERLEPKQGDRAVTAMDPSTRKLARIAGVLSVITFVTAIPALLCPTTQCSARPTTSSAPAPTPACWGRLLELLLIVANIGTALTLFPSSSGRTKASPSATSPPGSSNRLHRRRHPQPPVVRDVAAGPRAAARTARSPRQGARRAPRLDVLARPRLHRRRRERADARLPDVPVRPGAARHGHAGAHRRPADLRLGRRRVFGVFEEASAWQGIARIPEFLWELSLGIYLIVKGFKPSSPILTGAVSPAVATP